MVVRYMITDPGGGGGGYCERIAIQKHTFAKRVGRNYIVYIAAITKKKTFQVESSFKSP